jgi:hypothetical protein
MSHKASGMHCRTIGVEDLSALAISSCARRSRGPQQVSDLDLRTEVEGTAAHYSAASPLQLAVVSDKTLLGHKKS